MAFVFSMLVLCSRMDQTPTMLRNRQDHYCAWGLLRPLTCSGTAPTTAVLGDCSDSLCARGLSQPLIGESFFLATCDLYSHTIERHLFRPCYKAHTSPSSKLGDYIGTMHLPVHLVFLYNDWILNFSGNSF